MAAIKGLAGLIGGRDDEDAGTRPPTEWTLEPDNSDGPNRTDADDAAVAIAALNDAVAELRVDVANLREGVLDIFDGRAKVILDLQAQLRDAPHTTGGEIARGIIELQARFGALEKHVLGLSSQQAMIELQLERNVRGAALDLAIKARRDDEDAETTTLNAEGFLMWLKAGVSH